MAPIDSTRDFQVRVANHFKARFPYLYIPSFEEERVVAVIRAVVTDESLIKTPRALYTWSLTTGIAGDGAAPKEDTRAPLKALEFIERCEEPAVFILRDFHTNFGGQGRQADAQVVRKIRDLVAALKQSPRPKNVVFLSPVLTLPLELQKEITILEFDLPTQAEIRGLLEEMIQANRASGRIKIDLTDDQADSLAKAACGLTLQEAENCFARAMVEDGKLDAGDVRVVLDEKQQIIKKTEILEYVRTDLNLDDVGGLENLKRWLRKRNKSWDDGAELYGLPAPKGVLITGVPGCGKSLIAKAISAMWQLPLLRLDMGKIFAGIVGSSEENMRRAIKTAEAIAPSILWVDEIEKGMGGVGSGGDSGTSTRVFGTFLTWMQEKTQPVFVVATANNIHNLPPELMRKGRFDEIFFVDLPTQAERMEIFQLHLRKRLKHPKAVGDVVVTPELLTQLSDRSEGYIGAEIEQIVIDALFEAYAEDRSLSVLDLERAIGNTVPLSITQAEQIRAIREWANVRAVAATPKEDRAEYPLQVQPGKEDVRFSRGGRTVDF